MENYREVNGDLIDLAKLGAFDVIVQGNNCFNTQGAGLAPQMVKAFGTDKFPMELKGKGDVNKLGQIDYKVFYLEDEKWVEYPDEGGKWVERELTVVNAYTQYKYGRNHADGDKTPIDYDALTLVMKKINHKFKGKHIGLPRIGAGLAGGDWFTIYNIIKSQLKDCDVTVVNYVK